MKAIITAQQQHNSKHIPGITQEDLKTSFNHCTGTNIMLKINRPNLWNRFIYWIKDIFGLNKNTGLLVVHKVRRGRL